MTEWLRAHPFVVLLLPLVAGILCCDLTGKPFNLLRDTEVPWLDSTRILRLTVMDYPVEKARTYRYTAGNIYLYLSKDSARTFPELGDIVSVRTTVRRPDSLGSFDYARYLRRQGIAGLAFARSQDWQIVGHTEHLSLTMRARRLQHRLCERYRELGISDAESGTLSALTLGYREDLEPDIKRSFQRAGASHILAVSGLHTGIIYAVITLLITCFGRFKPLYEDRLHRCINGIIIIVIMWGYALLTGLSPSVTRSVLMLTLMQIAYICYRNPLSLNTVAAAAFFILVFRPNDLFSVSFQLSFAAVLSIIILVKPFNRLLPLPLTSHRFLRWTTQYLRDLVTVSLAAQIGTLPLTLYYFGQTCNYFILTNLVVIPLAFILTVTACATLTLGWIPLPAALAATGFSSIGTLLAYPLQALAWSLNHYTAWIENLPGAIFTLPATSTATSAATSAAVPTATLPMTLLFYAAIIASYLTFRHSPWWLTIVAASLAAFCMLAIT